MYRILAGSSWVWEDRAAESYPFEFWGELGMCAASAERVSPVGVGCGTARVSAQR